MAKKNNKSQNLVYSIKSKLPKKHPDYVELSMYKNTDGSYTMHAQGAIDVRHDDSCKKTSQLTKEEFKDFTKSFKNSMENTASEDENVILFKSDDGNIETYNYTGINKITDMIDDFEKMDKNTKPEAESLMESLKGSEFFNHENVNQDQQLIDEPEIDDGWDCEI